MLGVVNLDKPAGPTSHDMVALLRRLTGMRRIGHAGTLDPLASGVLPVLVGPATRFSEELTAGRKRYEAVVRLGWRSATDDAQGPIERGGPLPSEAAARHALATFVGTFPQAPPAYSARKMGGVAAHRAARAGAPIAQAPRPVTIESIEVLDAERREDRFDLRIDLVCGPGTYIRSLARDVGERLGSGGYLAALRRTEAAGLRIADAVTPERLETLAVEGRLASVIIPVGELLTLPRMTLEAGEAARFRNGSTVPMAEPGTGGGRVAVFADRALVGIGRLEAGMLHPEKVVAEVLS